MAGPALPACLCPDWWAARRVPFLAAARVLMTLLYAAQLLGASAPAATAASSLAEVILVHSGAAALCFMPFR